MLRRNTTLQWTDIVTGITYERRFMGDAWKPIQDRTRTYLLPLINDIEEIIKKM